MSTGLRDDELSKRYFYIGCLGLPWLWIVHALYWHGKQKPDSETLLDPSTSTKKYRLGEKNLEFRVVLWNRIFRSLNIHSLSLSLFNKQRWFISRNDWEWTNMGQTRSKFIGCGSIDMGSLGVTCTSHCTTAFPHVVVCSNTRSRDIYRLVITKKETKSRRNQRRGSQICFRSIFFQQAGRHMETAKYWIVERCSFFFLSSLSHCVKGSFVGCLGNPHVLYY